jgi:hypothetical protein
MPQAFHYTLTVAWVRCIAGHSHDACAAPFDTFLSHNAELTDSALLLRFYSRERLYTTAARTNWREPDLQPLPLSRHGNLGHGMLVKRLGEAARKGSLKMPKGKARPVTVSMPQKGRSKSKGGIALDELLAARRRPVLFARQRSGVAREFGLSHAKPKRQGFRDVFSPQPRR